MNNRQAAGLRPGTRIRRKESGDDATIYIVERVQRPEHPTRVNKNDVVVRAGGHLFRPWEIERVDPRPGWSAS